MNNRLPGLRGSLRTVSVLAVLALSAVGAPAARAALPSGSVGVVTEVTPTSALAQGTVLGGGEETGYHFEYATGEGGPWLRGDDSFTGQTVAAGSTPTPVSELLHGSYEYFGEPSFDFFIALTPATHYFVRLAAENASGTFYSGAPYVQFTTLPIGEGGSANPCIGDLCQPLPAEPEDPTPGTRRTRPSGNLPPPKKHAKECRKGQIKKHGRCVKQTSKKSKKKHGHGGAK